MAQPLPQWHTVRLPRTLHCTRQISQLALAGDRALGERGRHVLQCTTPLQSAITIEKAPQRGAVRWVVRTPLQHRPRISTEMPQLPEPGRGVHVPTEERGALAKEYAERTGRREAAGATPEPEPPTQKSVRCTQEGSTADEEVCVCGCVCVCVCVVRLKPS